MAVLASFSAPLKASALFIPQIFSNHALLTGKLSWRAPGDATSMVVSVDIPG
jgi:hypothetical protein